MYRKNKEKTTGWWNWAIFLNSDILRHTGTEDLACFPACSLQSSTFFFLVLQALERLDLCALFVFIRSDLDSWWQKCFLVVNDCKFF